MILEVYCPAQPTPLPAVAAAPGRHLAELGLELSSFAVFPLAHEHAPAASFFPPNSDMSSKTGRKLSSKLALPREAVLGRVRGSR